MQPLVLLIHYNTILMPQQAELFSIVGLSLCWKRCQIRSQRGSLGYIQFPQVHERLNYELWLLITTTGFQGTCV